MFKLILRSFIFGFFLGLCGCGSEQIARELTQKQANEIVAVLSANGIAAQADSDQGGRDRFTVNVDSENFTAAVTILRNYNLPPQQSKLEELLEQRGLIPNSREIEAKRVERAGELKVEEVLMHHDAVASARVGISQLDVSDAQQVAKRSVVVMLRTRPGEQISEEEVKEIVHGLVPDTDSETITVSMQSVSSSGGKLLVEGVENRDGQVVRIAMVPFLFGWRVARDDYTGLALTVLLFIVLVTILAGLLGYSYGAYRRSDYESHMEHLPEPAMRTGRLDRGLPNLPEE
ncbi:MAG: hypothetical protein KDD42_03670 [Bdellovibrionales bacterium]|nr:hypothetical protein [Bdellovibrionales bacterium]